MIGLIQRVTNASVEIESTITAKIEQGILAFVCFNKADNEASMQKMAHKIINYRIFSDENNKMNISVKDINGSILIVPQFTLSANTNKGLRPSFDSNCPPDIAQMKFNEFLNIINEKYRNIKNGVFGADMKISLCNDGPITFWLETD